MVLRRLPGDGKHNGIAVKFLQDMLPCKADRTGYVDRSLADSDDLFGSIIFGSFSPEERKSVA